MTIACWSSSTESSPADCYPSQRNRLILSGLFEPTRSEADWTRRTHVMATPGCCRQCVGRIPDLPGGGPWRARGARACNGGLGAKPQRDPEQNPWWGSGGEDPWSWKLFVYYCTNRGPKVKYLNKRKPLFLVHGVAARSYAGAPRLSPWSGRPVRPYRHCACRKRQQRLTKIIYLCKSWNVAANRLPNLTVLANVFVRCLLTNFILRFILAQPIYTLWGDIK